MTEQTTDQQELAARRAAAIDRIAERDRARMAEIEARLHPDTGGEPALTIDEQRQARYERIVAGREARAMSQAEAKARPSAAEQARLDAEAAATSHTPPARRTSGMATTEPAGSSAQVRRETGAPAATVQQEARLAEQAEQIEELQLRIERIETGMSLLLSAFQS